MPIVMYFAVFGAVTKLVASMGLGFLLFSFFFSFFFGGGRGGVVECWSISQTSYGVNECLFVSVFYAFARNLIEATVYCVFILCVI